MIIEMFAIRNIHTGHYLPGRTGSSGRGSTWSEPVAPSGDLNKLPRLHKTRKTAATVLTYWLKGSFESDGNGGFSRRSPIPKSNRKREDMEVVRIILEVPE